LFLVPTNHSNPEFVGNSFFLYSGNSCSLQRGKDTNLHWGQLAWPKSQEMGPLSPKGKGSAKSLYYDQYPNRES
jgi:hypothetical protein